MHTDIAYNSLPVSELLAEFDERWPLPLPDSDRVQKLVDRLLDGGYAKLGANMRKRHQRWIPLLHQPSHQAVCAAYRHHRNHLFPWKV